MRKKVSEKNDERFEIIQVGKIWAVKNNNPSKIIVYTEKKNEAVKIVRDLIGA